MGEPPAAEPSSGGPPAVTAAVTPADVRRWLGARLDALAEKPRADLVGFLHLADVGEVYSRLAVDPDGSVRLMLMAGERPASEHADET